MTASDLRSGARVQAASARSWWPVVFLLVLIVATGWQVFRLGFYLDDYPLLVQSATTTGRFSFDRLSYFWRAEGPQRLAAVPLRYLASVAFDGSSVAWQTGLLVINGVIGILLARAIQAAFVPTDTSPPAAPALLFGALWSFIPWNLGFRVWATLVPALTLTAVFTFTVAFCLRRWAEGRTVIVLPFLLYWYVCAAYEAFYLQFIPLVLLGLIAARGDRKRIRAVAISSLALFVAQLAAIGFSTLSVRAFGGMRRGVEAGFIPAYVAALRGLPGELARSFEGIRRLWFLAILTVVAGWIVTLVLRKKRSDVVPMTSERIMVATLICGFGALLSLAPFVLAGRPIQSLGVDSRTLGPFTLWILIGVGVMASAVWRAYKTSRPPLLIGGVLLMVMFVSANLQRSSEWADAYGKQLEILATAPVTEMDELGAEDPILYLGTLGVNGAPVFAADWDINAAMKARFPVLAENQFVMWSPWIGVISLDSHRIYRPGMATIEGRSVYAWEPEEHRFSRIQVPMTVDGTGSLVEAPGALTP